MNMRNIINLMEDYNAELNSLKNENIKNQVLSPVGNSYSVNAAKPYDFFRFMIQMGAHTPTVDRSQPNFVTFYTDIEEERFKELCAKLGVGYSQITSKQKELPDTYTKSAVPSPEFRYVDI